jgi:flagellar biosynthesis protein FlhF
MEVHTFRADSLQAALQEVRRTLGPDASILNTREKRGSRLGLFGRPLIEVDATTPVLPAAASLPADELQAVVAEPIPESRELPQGLQQLTEAPIEAPINVSGGIDLSQRRDGQPLVVALVGPTGAGKTTSLAKIAAGLHWDEGYRVGLMGLDSVRLGAVDQLLHYADWLSAPLEVVSSAEEVGNALLRLRSCDVVLLDTAGRAPRDHRQLTELRKTLELAQPDATHLVVSASSAVGHVEQTLRAFAEIKPTHLIISKLDESVDFGLWSSLLQTCSMPISYLTFGQQVPQDIVAATSSRVNDWLVGSAQ